MGVRLMVEVLDCAPAELGVAERLLLVALAEKASDDTRAVIWSRGDNPRRVLAARLGIAERNLTKVFGRLAQRGLDPRVQIGTDKHGAPVFGFEGTAVEYRIPPLRGTPNSAPLESERYAGQRTSEVRPTAHLGTPHGVPLEPERYADGRTHVPPSLRDPSNARATAPSGASLPPDQQKAVVELGLLGGVTVERATAAVLAVVRKKHPANLAAYVSRFSAEDVIRWASDGIAPAKASDPRQCPHGLINGYEILGTGSKSSRRCGRCEIDVPAPAEQVAL